MVDVWPAVHAERAALLEDLRGLTAEQWDGPSLCQGWSIRQVFGHLTSTARLTPPTFLAAMIGAGFNFAGFTGKQIARETAGSVADQLTAFGTLVTATSHPPGPLDSWLGEVLVHSEDIRRPLKIHRDYPVDAVLQVAGFYSGSNLLIGSKRRIDGVTLQATDGQWSHGSGPLVRGPAHSLLLAMTGRKAALDDLSGDGVEVLRGRP